MQAQWSWSRDIKGGWDKAYTSISEDELYDLWALTAAYSAMKRRFGLLTQDDRIEAERASSEGGDLVGLTARGIVSGAFRTNAAHLHDRHPRARRTSKQ